MTILKGSTSQETAYLVTDYPYGFRLRCQIKYWLEYKKGKGIRFCSQTSNPKSNVLIWNKPKYSTYATISACMFLDDNSHVTWTGLNQYSNYVEAVAWNEKYRDGVPIEALSELDKWIKGKEIYEIKLKNGIDYVTAGRETVLEMINLEIKSN